MTKDELKELVGRGFEQRFLIEDGRIPVEAFVDVKIYILDIVDKLVLDENKVSVIIEEAVLGYYERRNIEIERKSMCLVVSKYGSKDILKYQSDKFKDNK